MKITHVYGLYEGFSNQPFYVGVSVDPKRRLNAHRATLDGRRKDALSGHTIKSSEVTMRLLAQCDDRGHAETIEKALQVHFGIKVVTTDRLVETTETVATVEDDMTKGITETAD